MKAARHAFTLIETLLAVALFALTLGALAASIHQVLLARIALQEDRAQESTIRLVRAYVLGLSKRADIESGGDFPMPDDSKVTWKVELEPATVLDLYKMKLSIQISDTAVEQTLWVLRPGWGSSSESAQWSKDAQMRVEAARPKL